MQDIHLFGITGKKASGKSTVAKIFRQNNIPVVDVDCLYKDMFKPGNNVHREIIKCFGYDLLTENGNIDLHKLSLVVCREYWIKQTIDDLIEEEVEGFINKLIETFIFHGIDIAGIESGILCNTKMINYVSSVVFIDAPSEARMERMRATMPEGAISKIIKMEIDDVPAKDDFTIMNDGMDLEKKTIDIIKELLFFFRRKSSSSPPII